MNLIEEYKKLCDSKGIPFQVEQSVLSYDDTTLFCPAGMQQFKKQFKDTTIVNKTIANVQPCIRLNDLDLLGDGTHLAYFNMVGLFSFRDMSMYKAVDFWADYMKLIGLEIDEVHIHPDKLSEWLAIYQDLFNERTVRLIPDVSCEWSDGDIGGYCMEFYKDGVEVGNIVNPLGDCIDVGFGLERLDQLVNDTKSKTKIEGLLDAIMAIIFSDVKPSNKGPGYVLRKLLRQFVKEGGYLEHKYYHDELQRQESLILKYSMLKDKHSDKSPEWWFDTHGIDLTLV